MYKCCCTLGGELNPTLIHLESISGFMLLESTWRYKWFKSISEPLITMNFARAARGTPTRESMLREVDSQSEIELGRHLDGPERGILMSRFPLDVIVRCIDKVSNIFNKSMQMHPTTIVVWVWYAEVSTFPW